MAIVNISMDIGPWRSVNDGVMGGRSAGGMTQSIEGLKFEGRLSLENNGGFSSVRRLISQDISRATGVRIQVRGDGRQYQFFGRGLIGPIIWVARGEDIKLVDGGLQRRGFTDVSDGIAALVKIIENKDGIADSKIYNIGNPSNDLSIKELASLMLEMSYGIGWHMAHLLLE